MPELPEVETVVRDLRPLLVGRRITSVQFGAKALRRQWAPEWGSLLCGRRVCEVRRRGKWIVTALDGSELLVVHLGMTGQFKVVPAHEPLELHTHLIIDLDRGTRQLRFRDIRRFGSASVFRSEQELNDFFGASGLGPEPFDLPLRYFRERLAATTRCLKAVLLDQRVVAGVGNIYADESLFAARLRPTRTGRATTAREARRLRDAVAKVLTRAIEQRGSSIRNYVGGSGLKGQYQDEFLVYGRAGEPCRRCGTPIERIRLAGRSTHYCPRCQQK